MVLEVPLELRLPRSPVRATRTAIQFMVHDGDQNKTGGDVGQLCVNVNVPAA